jgi:hypothetical protein
VDTSYAILSSDLKCLYREIEIIKTLNSFSLHESFQIFHVSFLDPFLDNALGKSESFDWLSVFELSVIGIVKVFQKL